MMATLVSPLATFNLIRRPHEHMFFTFMLMCLQAHQHKRKEHVLMRATNQVECGERGHQGCHHSNLKASSFPLPDAQRLVVLSHESTWGLNLELKYARKTCEKQEGQEYPEERVHRLCAAAQNA